MQKMSVNGPHPENRDNLLEFTVDDSSDALECRRRFTNYENKQSCFVIKIIKKYDR